MEPSQLENGSSLSSRRAEQTNVHEKGHPGVFLCRLRVRQCLFHDSVLQFIHRIQLEQNQSGPSLKLVTRTVTESLSGSSPKVLVLVIHSQQVWTELHSVDISYPSWTNDGGEEEAGLSACSESFSVSFTLYQWGRRGGSMTFDWPRIYFKTGQGSMSTCCLKNLQIFRDVCDWSPHLKETSPFQYDGSRLWSLIGHVAMVINSLIQTHLTMACCGGQGMLVWRASKVPLMTRSSRGNFPSQDPWHRFYIYHLKPCCQVAVCTCVHACVRTCVHT